MTPDMPGANELIEPRKWAQGWRRLIFPGVFLIYLAQTAHGVAQDSSGVAVVIGALVLAAFCVVYITALPAWWAGALHRFWVLYALLLALFVIELFFAHEDALPMLVFVAVLTIGALGGRGLAVIAVFGLVALVLPPLVPSWHAGVDANVVASLVLVSLAMFGFFAVVRANRQLSEARAEVARLAAVNERNRIARDLHDLLGHSLTTITVKSGLARRLVADEPERAEHEMAEVEDLSRRALTDVRAAVANYRDVTLVGELATGRELLRAAGVVAQLPGATDVVVPEYQELFAWVLREGLTNVVRHSRASVCTVTIGPNTIEIVDDGRTSPSTDGSGLTGLRERVESMGGTITAGPTLPVGWRLRATMPATDSEASSRPTERQDHPVST